MSIPFVTVEIAFTSGYRTPLASMVWTDVSTYLEGQDEVTINRGRSDEFSEIEPGQLQLTLDNRDGRFTPGYEAGAHWPNVKKGRPIRVSVTYEGVSYVRFLGYVDAWPMSWPSAGDEDCRVAITATSRTARSTAVMRSVIEEEWMSPQPRAYYTLGEPAEATVAVDSSGRQGPNLAQAGTGTAVTFATATGPGTDAMSSPTFSAGMYLSSVLPVTFDTTGGYTVAAAFNTTIAAGTVLTISSHTVVQVNASGKLVVSASGINPMTSTKTVSDGATHLVVVKVPVSLTVLPTLEVDGVVEATSARPLYLGARTSNTVTVGQSFTGSISHAAVWESVVDSTDSANMQAAVTSGFAGETPGAAVRRFARYWSVPGVEVNADAGTTSSLLFIDTTGKTPLEAMRLVENTEYGNLYDGRTGTLEFRGRAARINSTTGFTLSAVAQEVGGNLAPKLDDQGMMNIIEASRATAGAPRVYVTNQASVDEYGPYAATLELVTTSDAEAVDTATWRVSRYGEPSIRIPSVEVDVANLDATPAAAILAADIGTRFELSNLPTQAPWSSVDLFIEGTAEVLTFNSHTLSMNTSTTDLFAAWELGTANRSELGQATVLTY